RNPFMINHTDRCNRIRLAGARLAAAAPHTMTTLFTMETLRAVKTRLAVATLLVVTQLLAVTQLLGGPASITYAAGALFDPQVVWEQAEDPNPAVRLRRLADF